MFGSIWSFQAALVICVSLMQTGVSAASAVAYPLPGYCMKPPPRSEGHCTIAMEGFYYNQRTGKCETYEVGGCRTIPGQSFGSIDDCLATCVYRTRRIQDLYTIE